MFWNWRLCRLRVAQAHREEELNNLVHRQREDVGMQGIAQQGGLLTRRPRRSHKRDPMPRAGHVHNATKRVSTIEHREGAVVIYLSHRLLVFCAEKLSKVTVVNLQIALHASSSKSPSA